MIRCKSPAGAYKVTFEYVDDLGIRIREDIIAHLGTHKPVMHRRDDGTLERDPQGRPVVIEDIPRVSVGKPFEGEICEHELEWATHIPGKRYNAHWRFGIEQVQTRARKK